MVIRWSTTKQMSNFQRRTGYWIPDLSLRSSFGVIFDYYANHYYKCYIILTIRLIPAFFVVKITCLLLKLLSLLTGVWIIIITIIDDSLFSAVCTKSTLRALKCVYGRRIGEDKCLIKLKLKLKWHHKIRAEHHKRWDKVEIGNDRNVKPVVLRWRTIVTHWMTCFRRQGARTYSDKRQHHLMPPLHQISTDRKQTPYHIEREMSAIDTKSAT